MNKTKINYLSALYDAAKELYKLEVVNKEEQVIRGVDIRGIDRDDECALWQKDGKIHVGIMPGYKHMASRHVVISARTITYKEVCSRGYYGKGRETMYEEKNTERLQGLFKIIKENKEAILEYLKDNDSLRINTGEFEKPEFTKEYMCEGFTKDGEVCHVCGAEDSLMVLRKDGNRKISCIICIRGLGRK